MYFAENYVTCIEIMDGVTEVNKEFVITLREQLPEGIHVYSIHVKIPAVIEWQFRCCEQLLAYNHWLLSKFELHTFKCKNRNLTVTAIGTRKWVKETYSSFSVDICAVPEQDAYDVGLIGASGEMECGLSADGREVGTGAMLDQIDDDVHVSHEWGHMQRREARLRKVANIHH